MSPSHSSGFHLLPKAVTRTGQVGKMKHEGRGSVVGPPSSHLLQLPSVITALLYYGICVEKKLQLATNKNQHNLSQWIILKPPLSNTPTLTRAHTPLHTHTLTHTHKLFHITCWCAPPPYLHFYWPIISLSPQSVLERGAQK